MSQRQMAKDFAFNAHKGQEYAEGVPYSYHLGDVVNVINETYKDKVTESELETLATIGYLHDVIEDTEVTYFDLYQHGFNLEVVTAVGLLTKREGLDYEAYISSINKNELARKVKLCDTASNLWHSLSDCNEKRINKYTKQIQMLGGF